MLVARKEELKKHSSIIVVDAWFYKRCFVDEMLSVEFAVVVRAKKNSCYRYFHNGPKTNKRGRPKIFDSKFDPNNIDRSHFNEIKTVTNESAHAFGAIVFSTALKRKVKLVILVSKKNEKIQTMFVSTKLTLDGEKVQENYKQRFQIEFLYRDGKQHTGLNSCQARSENKLHTHVNISLSAINVAKFVNHYEHGKQKQTPFSMSDVKQINYNRLILEMFFSKLSLGSKYRKIKNIHRELVNYGCKSA